MLYQTENHTSKENETAIEAEEKTTIIKRPCLYQTYLQILKMVLTNDIIYIYIYIYIYICIFIYMCI